VHGLSNDVGNTKRQANHPLYKERNMHKLVEKNSFRPEYSIEPNGGFCLAKFKFRQDLRNQVSPPKIAPLCSESCRIRIKDLLNQGRRREA